MKKKGQRQFKNHPLEGQNLSVWFFFHREKLHSVQSSTTFSKILWFWFNSTKEKNFKAEDQASNIWSQYDTVG